MKLTVCRDIRTLLYTNYKKVNIFQMIKKIRSWWGHLLTLHLRDHKIRQWKRPLIKVIFTRKLWLQNSIKRKGKRVPAWRGTWTRARGRAKRKAFLARVSPDKERSRKKFKRLQTQEITCFLSLTKSSQLESSSRLARSKNRKLRQ